MNRVLTMVELFVALLTAVGLYASPPAAVRLLPGVPIYLVDGQPEPVRRAVTDLQRDLRAVLGQDSPIVNRIDSRRPGIIIVTADPASPDIAGREAHAVFIRSPHVVLDGADTRGTIYAIYTFSERFLGVPPLWFWSSWKPVLKAGIDVPAHTNLRFATPYVHWRVWFPNDEDLLTPWRARSAENYEAFLETMLRLKMNTLEGEMMDKESFDHPYEAGRQFRLARDRGLAVTGHHMRIFGSNYDHWNLYWTKIRHQDPPKLAIANVQALEDFWRYHIETGMREKFEMIWLTGFRGDGDIPFWQTFPDSPTTDVERARVIEEMMKREVTLLKNVTGEQTPVMRVTLYNENSDFFAQGLLHPPDEPNLTWVFVAARRDHFPAADVRRFRNDAKRRLGYYLNFQFTSSGAHLAQAEGPWKMERNFRMVNAVSGRPLELSVVNAGNIREFVLELSADARMMWDFERYRTDEFLKDFCAEYFGDKTARAIADLYRDFFDSYWTQKKPDLPGFERQYVFQDMRYARATEQLVTAIVKGRNLNPLNELAMDKNGGYFRIVPEDSGARNQIEAILKGTAAAAVKLSAIVAKGEKILETLPEDRRTFFSDDLLVQARFMLHLNQMLGSVSRAMDVLPDKERSVGNLREASSALAKMRADLREAEHDRFSGWYAGDRLFGLDSLNQRIDSAIQSLNRERQD